MSELTALTKEQAGFAERGLVLVRDLARVAQREWPAVPESDFVSVGHEAVVKAAQRFDPKRGVRFEQFARHAVWGVMLDLAHRETFVVRATVRAMTRALRDQIELEQSTDAWLDPEPAPQRAEVISTVRGRIANLVAVAVAGADKAPTAEDVAIEEEERRITLRRLQTGLGELEPDERAFVRAYYEEEQTLEAIAKEMGVVKRTVQRLHDRIKAKLAAALRSDPG